MSYELEIAGDRVAMYKQMDAVSPNSSILREVSWQYCDMANGGDGGELGYSENGFTTCRGLNYPEHSDAFFQFVCDGMGWKWKSHK